MKSSFLFLCIMICFIHASDKFYYYKYKEPKILKRIDTKIVICFNQEYSEKYVIQLSTKSNAIKEESIQVIAPKVYLAEINPSYKISEVKDKLIKFTEICSIEPLYETKDEGAPLYFNGEICLEFFSGISVTKIEDIIKSYDLQVIHSLPTKPYYLVKPDKSKDVLSIANRIVSSPKFTLHIFLSFFLPTIN